MMIPLELSVFGSRKGKAEKLGRWKHGMITHVTSALGVACVPGLFLTVRFATPHEAQVTALSRPFPPIGIGLKVTGAWSFQP
jgi:hypothetical protein